MEVSLSQLKDKFDAEAGGWPIFSKPIENTTLTEKEDYKLNRKRTESEVWLASFRTMSLKMVQKNFGGSLL